MFKTTRTYTFLISGILILALSFIYGCGSVTGGGGGGGGSPWVTVGNTGFSSGPASYLSLFISS